jgi:iron complex outermembrane receptor protein
MWFSNNRILYSLLLLSLTFLSSAQDCQLAIKGLVMDEHTAQQLSLANIRIKETGQGTSSNEDGVFILSGVCPGSYHLVVSHIGCSSIEIYIDLKRDTVLEIHMDHHHHMLQEVSLYDDQRDMSTQEERSIGPEQLSARSDANLARALESVIGVSLISAGGNISKPVIQGLYGNRITILNNGIAQAGQQWGVDHAPEIDFLVADRLTVIKGVGALRYQGSSLGGIILVEPQRIPDEPHLHGELKTYFQSNGRGGGLHINLRQHSNILAWKVMGTVKKMGDMRSPNYFLRNTGAEEANFALQLEKDWSGAWSSEAYLSSYNTNLGILRGSHIGNLSDLEEAIGREIPFFTEDNFSYAIDPPYQNVHHHLWKLGSKYLITDHHWLDFTYSGQLDLRKEYDVRRSGRSDIPALSLEQWNHFLQGIYHQYLPSEWDLEAGMQYQFTQNTNDPETGILPLIPDYNSNEFGLFAVLRKDWSRLIWEMGARLDMEDRRVAAISQTLPREIVRYNELYQSINAQTGLIYHLNEQISLSYNLGLASRAPEVNELYSNGLHQGVGGIEEGDPDLGQERSLKQSLSLIGHLKENFFLETLVYLQHIDNYIFLNPQDELRLTIRGAFPVFRYEQTDARLFGFDLSSTVAFTDQFNFLIKYAFLRGDDLGNGIPLNFMAPNNLFGELQYNFRQQGEWINPEVRLNARYVFEQTHIVESQDYLPPPESYLLIGFQSSVERQFKDIRLQTFLRVDNLLNTVYRDYLNRQRYFADDLGINLVIGINIGF